MKKGGKAPDILSVSARSGIVHGSKTWASTQVHSSGGGGYVGRHGGYVQPARVASTNTKHDTFFLVEDDGKEFEVELANIPFNVRDGHHVTAIYAAPQNKVNLLLTTLYNHNTENRAKVQPGYNQVCGFPGLLIFFAAMAMAIIFGLFAQSFIASLVGVAVYIVYTFFVAFPQAKARSKQLDQQAKKLIKVHAASAPRSAKS